MIFTVQSRNDSKMILRVFFSCVYSQLKCLLIKAANKEPYLEELQFVTNFYGGDVCKDQRKLHLEVFTNSIPSSESGKRQTFKSIVQFLSDLSHAQRLLMSQVCSVVSLVLLMLATNATSERSFSTLRRIKNYLRSTMTQRRLNNAMVLHIYSHLTESLSLTDIGNEFIHGSEHRLTYIGKFTADD